MPHVRIEIKKGWADGRKAELIEAVHAALVEGIKIPKNDRVLRLIEHDPENFVTASGSEKSTLVHITLFAGRSGDAKRALYQAVVRNLSALGVPPLDVHIVLVEVPRENWGIRGGQAASDVDLGFAVQV